MVLSVIIPAYNEERTISDILNKVLQTELIGGTQKEIILVDDCSTDNTHGIIDDYINTHPEASIQYVRHTVNRGKGAALRTGIQSATGDYVIVQDADLEYDPQEFNILLRPILDGFADVVFGSRFSGGNAHRILFFGILWETNSLRPCQI